MKTFFVQKTHFENDAQGNLEVIYYVLLDCYWLANCLETSNNIRPSYPSLSQAVPVLTDIGNQTEW